MLAPASPSPKIRRAIATTANSQTFARAVRCFLSALVFLVSGAALGTLLDAFPAALVSVFAGLIWAGTAFLVWREVERFHPVSRDQAAHLIEERWGLVDLAPLTGGDDRAAIGDSALWAWHQRTLIEAQSKLAGPVYPRPTRRDWILLAALLGALGIALAKPESAARALWFDLSPLAGDGALAIEVWAEPPAYTGQPVVRLNLETSNVRLIAGSKLMARVDGARGAPRLMVPGASQTMERGRTGAWTATLPLTRSGTVALYRFGKRAAWQVEAIKDTAPNVTLTGPITVDSRGRLSVSYKASDDFGIAALVLSIKPVRMPEGLRGRPVDEVTIPLDDADGMSGAGEDEDGTRQIFVDVTQHVMAGLQADVSLLARDALGQEAQSEPTRLTMPQRQWKSTLGAAIAEQRLMILREGRPWRWSAPALAQLYDASSDTDLKLDLREPILSAPDGIAKAHALMSAMNRTLKQSGLFDVGVLGLSLAQAELEGARTPQAAHGVAPLLWQLALSFDAQGQSPAQARLQEAREALEDALKNGASDDEIKSLTQELKEAVRERVQELAEQGQAESGDSGGPGQMQSDGGSEITGGDLDAMLEQLERNGSSGAREEALNQLDELDQLMQGLQVRPGGSGSGSGGEIDDALRSQRDLSDETTQRGGQQPAPPADDLADRQEALADQISPPGQRPQDDGRPPNANGQDQGQSGQEQAARAQAGQAMREAAKALREGDYERAEAAQSQAEDSLRQAAQARQSGQGNGNNEDPLGRPSRRPDDGKATKVPKELEKRRARDVREELRRRQSDPQRDKLERDYIDRLLEDR